MSTTQDCDDQALAAIHADIEAAQDKFWSADPADQNDLRLQLADLYDAESKAKIAMLKSGQVTTDADIAQINAIGADIGKAADAQALGMAIARLTAFLLTLA